MRCIVPMYYWMDFNCRKYVEKLLKTKGIRKTLQGLHKIIRGTLHRAKIALEMPEEKCSHINMYRTG